MSSASSANTSSMHNEKEVESWTTRGKMNAVFSIPAVDEYNKIYYNPFVGTKCLLLIT